MYHTHSYTADGEELLQLPQYMYNGVYGESEPEKCWPIDVFCHARERERKKQEALNQTIDIPETDPRLLYGMMAGMALVFTLGAYFLFKSEKEEDEEDTD